MQHGEDRREVNKPVQALPAKSAQSPDHAVRRGDSQRKQHKQPGDPNRDVRPLDNVEPNHAEIETLIHYDIGDNVESDIEDRIESDHTAKRTDP